MIMNTNNFTGRNDGQIKDGELVKVSLNPEGNLAKPRFYYSKVYVMGVL